MKTIEELKEIATSGDANDGLSEDDEADLLEALDELAAFRAAREGWPSNVHPSVRDKDGNYLRVAGRLRNGDIETVYWDGASWRFNRNQERALVMTWYPRYGESTVPATPAEGETT